MKTITLMTMLLILSITSIAQSDKYTVRMTALVAQLDTLKTPSQWSEIGAAFERVAESEKTQWLPYYYAALGKVNAARMSLGASMGGNTDITDPAADKADELLNKAIALNKVTSETLIITKMIASLRMMGDPMSRFMKYGPLAAEALAKAKKMDPTNPRVLLLEGEDKYFTPEQFGGSKEEGRVLFTKAVELFKAFKPETTLHPNWGLNMAMYLLSLKD
jgi:hypothetical protein